MKVSKFFNKQNTTALSITLVVGSIIFGLSKCGVNLSYTDFWKKFYQIEKALGIKFNIGLPEVRRQIDQQMITDPELLNFKVKIDVDQALREYEKQEKRNYVPNMKNTVILKEIEKSKYTATQKLIVKDAIYYECSPDESVAQSQLGGAMGIRGVWTEKTECEK